MSTATQDALADLLEISSQIECVALVGDEGAAAAAGLAAERADRFARAAQHLLTAAESDRGSEVAVAHVEVDLGDAAIFVVREAGTTIAAVTSRSPTSGLVLYDLRACLRRLAAEAPKKKRRKPASEDAAA